MMEEDHSRRLVLKGIGAVGTTTSLTRIIPEATATGSGGSTIMLGSFESGFDGWKTNGGNKLSRVEKGETTKGIPQGSHALEVSVQGDLHPMIENVDRVTDADFSTHPYLFLETIPGPVGKTGSDLTVIFRYHHGPTEDAGDVKGPTNRTVPQNQTTSRAAGEKPVNVIESPAMQIPTHVETSLTWDMSNIAEEKLQNPERLEITWYPTEHPPDRGARGRQSGFEYRSDVLFDHIRLSDNQTHASLRQIATRMTNYKLNHGPIVTTNVESIENSIERGAFVFSDGTEIPYRFELVADGPDRYVIDGTTYLISGDEI